ncbi:uncharacterized protein LOC123444097 [Hordeum vulgare subsp. vulgare]|uniref:Predicted protein n=1 Tax=Hordeum vulgare subsp. vulgare TaxID=112509 RepID=F2DDB2_HORVV|nr:uncharacterized protein LOC123444097 [Hordeum vulgare subsp. vulgare]BAJ93083.1 predicted protein [Hordeum vulgare subsp. vulgare]
MAPIRRAAQRPDFASHPSDLELITTYLTPWSRNRERPWKFIHEADVYAARPQDLARAYAPATASDGQESWYFFTILRTKSRRGQRKSRTVGSGDHGCWHSERAAKPLFAGIGHSRQIGYRQAFSFATKEDGRLVRSGWLMAEIGLNPDASSPDEVVLCKVYRSPRVKTDQRSTAAAAAAAATGVGPQRIARGKASEDSTSSEEGTPRAGPGRYSAQPARASASTSGTLSMVESDSDSEQDSTSLGGTSPSATPPRIPRIPTVPSDESAQRPDFSAHPSDQVLIKSYLTPRVASGEHPCHFTHDADVYTASPGALTRTYSPAMASDGEKAWYFFTVLPAKSAHGQRRPRTVGTGEGCWHSEAGVKPVLDGDHPIGWRQFFSFMSKEEGQRVRSIRTGWIMVEIGLDHGQQEGPSDEPVLCKVYRSPRAGPVVEPKAAAGRKRNSKRRLDTSGAGTPVLTLGHALGTRNSTATATATATATSSSGRKKRKTDSRNPGPVLRPARGVLKLTRPATPGRKKKDLCVRCGVEPAESHSGTAEEEDGSETDLVEDDSMTGESAAIHGNEAGESSGGARTFYQFV